MSNTTTSEEVAFIQRHEPPIQDGEYEIQVSHTVDLLGLSIPVLNKKIFVSGERFSIEKKNISSCFPPPANTGNYASVLPHITLTRSTLPWERQGLSGNKELPWMWLFVYDDHDIAAGHVKIKSDQALSAVFDIDNNTSPLIKEKITLEPGEQNTDQVDLVQINGALLSQVFPSNDELQLLTSVRKNTVGTDVTELGICMANRMPDSGVKSYACLLSLEGRLQATTGPSPAALSNLESASTAGWNTFVSLHSWSFSCLDDNCYQITPKGKMALQKLSTPLPASLLTVLQNLEIPDLYTTGEAFSAVLSSAVSANGITGFSTYQSAVMSCFQVPDRTFQGILQDLHIGTITLEPSIPATTTGATDANNYLTQGAMPFTHQLQDGGQTISWYHGPFRPSAVPPTHSLPTAVMSSDELLRLNTNLNMLDVSYAAAWELGRQLTLNNKTVAMDIFLWKRQQKWSQNPSKHQTILVPEPVAGDTKESTKEETAIKDWCTDLLYLVGVPFNYLVPDERLLPNESIRFFTLDNLWMQSLIDGALSIGRATAADQVSDQSVISAFIDLTQSYSGVLLRSEVVEGWPHLELAVTDSAGNALTQVHKALLAPDLLLVIYEGDIDTLDVHLKPEALHFGFEVSYEKSTPDTPSYSKEVRFNFGATGQVTSISSPSSIPIQWKTPPASGNPQVKVVDIKGMNGSLQSNSESTETFTSAQFAMEMVAGVPHVYFAQPSKS